MSRSHAVPVAGVPGRAARPIADGSDREALGAGARSSDALDYRPQLDGLRAIAVAAVVWSHWERPYQFGLPFGAGVHLFYVLSGFLITRILLNLRAAPQRGGALRAFYLRRALRIFPAFYLALALAWLGDVSPLRDTLAWHAGYLSNLLIFSTGDWQGSLSHLWSLAVEEQFYLVWPWLVVFVPQRWLVPALVATVVSAPLFRWMLALQGVRENMLAVLTPGSMDSLGLGALLAVAMTRPGSPSSVGLARTAVPLSLSALWLALVAGSASLPLWLVACKQTVQAAVFTWVVWRAANGFDGTIGRLLSAPPLVYVGRISYGIYLAHGFAGEILGSVGVSSRALPEPLRFVVLAASTVAVAAASWHFFEQPINRLKRHFPYGSARVAPAS